MASSPALEMLADSIDRMLVEPGAPGGDVIGPLGAGELPYGTHALTFDIPGGEASIGAEGVSIKTTAGGIKVDGNGVTIDAPGGGISIDEGGVTIETPGGGVEIGSDGSVIVNPPGGKNGGTPSPGTGTSPFPGITTSPFEIPIPVPTFRMQPFEIPISVPTFSTDKLDIPIPFPHPSVSPFPVPFGALPQPPFGAFPQLPWGGLPQMPWGALASNAVLPPWLNGLAPPPLPALPTWSGPTAKWLEEIGEAVADTVEQWQVQAHFEGGTIVSMICILPPGSLRSGTDFGSTLRARMIAKGVPNSLASDVSEVLGDAWKDWAAGFSGQLNYPAFVAYPGPAAPPMPNIPLALIGVGASPGFARMNAKDLESGLRAELGDATDDPDVDALARQLPLWFSERFLTWCMTTIVMNVLGSGPVPSYTAPFTPAGPVIGGSVLPTPGVLVGNNPFQQMFTP